MFADVDTAGATKLEAFDGNGNLIASATASVFNNGLDFLAIRFSSPAIARIRVTQGNTAIGPNDNPAGGVDIVAVDDFIYGEPVAASSIPEPTSIELISAGLAAIFLVGRRARLGYRE